MRGIFAEFIVAKALGLACTEPREAWAVVDLVTSEGIKIEVKSAAHIQSWAQKRASPISFGYRASRPWNAETGELGAEAMRSADVYVFCLLKTVDRAKFDPLNLDEWEFYAVPTAWLNGRERSKSSITLASLRKNYEPVGFGDLQAAIARASIAGGQAR